MEMSVLDFPFLTYAILFGVLTLFGFVLSLGLAWPMMAGRPARREAGHGGRAVRLRA
jgi:hypothetical protein